MSLNREEVAHHLWEVMLKAGPNFYDSVMAVGDETIRLMEYARRCVGISGPMTHETADGKIIEIISPAKIHLGDLTLPPDDWSP